MVVQARGFSGSSVTMAFDLKWKIVSLYSLDFLEPVRFTFVRVILAFTAKGQWKRQYC